MAITTCDYCGGNYHWRWTEAFEKHGFNGGDGQVETWQVESVLTEAGYEVGVLTYGIHNTIICSIKKDGVELIPGESADFSIGYNEPREFLPAEIITLLDEKFPDSPK